MNADIYLKASELARVIAESDEGMRFREAERAIMNDAVAKSLAQRWHKVYDRVRDLMVSGQELEEKDARAVEFIEAKVENHPLMLEYIEAHKDFGELLSNVDGVLSAAFNFNLEPSTEGNVCAGCPSQGSCEVEPDSCAGPTA